MKKILWGLLASTKGGMNRARIIDALNKRPYNLNQLAEKLSLNYKTIKYHIDVLEKNKIVISESKGYGSLYFLSEDMENNFSTFLDIRRASSLDNNHIYSMEDKIASDISKGLIHH
jgi:DNA-binding transcriptional ArsR family regulator